MIHCTNGALQRVAVLYRLYILLALVSGGSNGSSSGSSSSGGRRRSAGERSTRFHRSRWWASPNGRAMPATIFKGSGGDLIMSDLAGV